eukprot:Gregarina_sp_Poly_1__7156@NODE_3921_length_823_cov_76_787037_g2062_i1_p1_GENE_NODE_3921_length_823_cov_76_787037_g2062_i1NODE_3921_length_823_cov_76_787037_g2062_i1_p1_ORF_typecomplete_len229_score17_11_NODE_3921_length_823_cov_76_787037_g2062_i152738
MSNSPRSFPVEGISPPGHSRRIQSKPESTAVSPPDEAESAGLLSEDPITCIEKTSSVAMPHSSPCHADGQIIEDSEVKHDRGGKSEGDNQSLQTKRQSVLMRSVKAITSMYKVGSLITPSVSTMEEAYQLEGVVNWGRTGVVYKASRIVKGTMVQDKCFALKIMWFEQEDWRDENDQLACRYLSLPVQSTLGRPQRSDGRERARKELEALLSAQAIPHVIKSVDTDHT